MIEVDNITKQFGPVLAVDQVSFYVARGEVVGFLGPNGAGKSTVMRILACFFPPTAGKARVGGYDVTSHSLEVRRMVGYFPEKASVYPDLPVRAFLSFVAEAKDVPRSRRAQEIGRVMESCGVQEVQERIIGHLSKGYRQRVGIAQALIHDPEVLILDEPTIGLDPEQVVEIRKLIHDLGKERTVILSTHILSEVGTVCDRVIVINRGRILTSESLKELRAQLQRTHRVRVEVEGPRDQAMEVFSRLPGVVRVEEDGLTDDRGPRSAVGGPLKLVVEYEGDDIRKEVGRTVLERGWGLLEIHSVEPTLEDIYLKLIHESGGAQEE
jgi:ABC-2 type transport system ATP-binding protein